MATYKLIQDIEAEDHILGPLTLRQFIFALITAFLLYLDFLCVIRGVTFLLILLLPPTLLVGFFAAPFSGDQPTEVWALAKIRFWFKPRKRLWNQSGVKELVTITVPKKIEHVYTDGLTQTEVQSRLKALANTIDTRGWAIKNINVGSYARNPMGEENTDRLFDIGEMPQAVPDEEFSASHDILDETNNPIAQQFDSMMNKFAQTHRQELITEMNSAAPAAPALARPQSATPPADYWFMQPAQNVATSRPPAPAAAAEPTAEELALASQFKQQANTTQATYEHMHTLQPLGSQPAQTAAIPAPAGNWPTPTNDQPAAGPPPATDPAILSLANNDDLNVATLAREAQKNKGEDEVVISLH